MVTFEDIRKNAEIKTYIEQGNLVLGALGFTEHSYAHAARSADVAANILRELEYDARTCELAAIAGYMHDIGNTVNRVGHAQSGAVMAFQILNRLGMPPKEVAVVVSAIGNHDEEASSPADAVAAALILADKSDVRRSRVRNRDLPSFDIHDRVNYAAKNAKLHLNVEQKTISLNITIDPSISSVMDYFEIFLHRMILCRKAADVLGLTFQLVINGNKLL